MYIHNLTLNIRSFHCVIVNIMFQLFVFVNMGICKLGTNTNSAPKLRQLSYFAST